MGIKYKSFDEKGAPLPEALLPEVPPQLFEFEPLTLTLRKAKEYAIWAWEQARLDGEYLLANPYISITRTVSSSRPALPFGDTPKPYRLLFLITCRCW